MKAHDDSTKAAVMAALMAGQGVRETARELGLSSSVVSRYKAQIGEKLNDIGEEKARNFGDMLGKYLEELLTTATVQQIHFRDKNWLDKQPASELAVLHGITIDKGIKLFEAASRASAVDSIPD